MENREKLEIPTIEFTEVTLLSGSGSTECKCPEYPCATFDPKSLVDKFD